MITINYLWILIPDLVMLILLGIWLTNNYKNAISKLSTFTLKHSALTGFWAFNIIVLIITFMEHVKITY